MSFLLSVVAGQGGVKVPGAPGTLSLSAGTDSNTEIDLSWSAPSDTGGGTISGYRIKKNGSVLVADTSSTGTTYTATGLTANTSYNFNVAAINEKGTGADGNTPSLSTTNLLLYTTTGSPTLTSYSGYKSLTWTGTGSLTVTGNPGSTTFDILTIAGGAGGAASTGGGGGGGAGGMKTFTSESLSTSTEYTITIGAGGAGGTPAVSNTKGSDGVASRFGSLEEMVGGGKGAPTDGTGTAGQGGDGGSGGGGGHANSYGGGSGTAGQGTDGGNGNATFMTYNAAGGGGKGYRGAFSLSGFWSGGIGAANSYKTGSNINYAGGGGAGGGNSIANDINVMGGGDWGGGTSTSGTGSPGDDNQAYGAGNGGGLSVDGGDAGANTGAGGGGSGQNDLGGSGGAGICVVRWAV